MRSKLFLGLVMLFGIAMAAPASANTARPLAASRAAHGVGTYIGGWGWYSCPWGTYPRYLNAGQNVWYDYRYNMYWTAWAPYSAVYCVQ